MRKTWSEYSKGEQILLIAYSLIKRPETPVKTYITVLKIIDKFINDPDEIDLMTICKLESLLDTKLLNIPTKQEWRKIKLEKLNNLGNEEVYEIDLIEFLRAQLKLKKK